ncbi:hypothetical protein CBR_g37763 [Chara braunii]|uniref:Cation-transporting P-type ATPase N-terminal domain-containing protein n=1 Tax=Chara braunii TaxID=69332 RepID=A0A388LNV0_CHABU|nr:hypothetical protein CBR_g37763 [Chara braunii]|eukprot:GBG83893.1 hypothetical protein CBR_g37763 [Chara braunii]
MDTSKGEENPQHATINNQGDSENMEKSDDGDGKKEGKHHVTFGGTEAQSVAIEIANPKSQDNKLGANSSQTGTSDPVHTGRIRSITAKVLAGAGVARSALSAIQAKLGKFSSLVLGQLSAGRIKLTSPQLLAKRSVVDKIETHEKQAAEMQRMQSCFVRVLEALGLRKSVLEVMHERLKEAIRNEFNIVEHTWEIDTVCQYYKTDREKGLPLPQAELHLEKWGPNKISPPKETHWLIKYLKSYTDLFAVLLMIAGVFCIAVYVMDPVENHVEIYLGFALFSVVFFSVTFDFVQRSKSAKVMEGVENVREIRGRACGIYSSEEGAKGGRMQGESQSVRGEAGGEDFEKSASRKPC